MNLNELIAALEEGEITPEDFASALEDNLPAYHRAIYNPAYEAGQTEAQGEVEAAQSKIASLRKEKKQLEEEAETLRNEQPELAELRGKYEQKMQDLQAKIEAKDAEINEVRTESEEQLRSRSQRFFHEQAKNYLLTEVGVIDEDIADVKIQKAMQDGMVRFDDPDAPRVFEPGGDVPAPNTQGKPAHVLFGERVADRIDEKFIEDRRPSSSGLGGTDGAGRQTAMPRSQFESLDPKQQMEHVKSGGAVVDD